jgi:hypothetical protein
MYYLDAPAGFLKFWILLLKAVRLNGVMISPISPMTLLSSRPSPLLPLVVIADTVNILGIITASGKGCQSLNSRVDPWKPPVFGFYAEETSEDANYCLCGAGGGGQYSGNYGGGAFGPSLVGATGSSCDLSTAELKQLLLSPAFNIAQLGCGGKGYDNAGALGGGPILLIARLTTLASTASLLTNGLDATALSDGGGGGAGFIGLLGDTLSVDALATLSANGGAKDGTGSDGGVGAIAQIEV